MYSASVSITVAVSVSRPIPETSFSSKVGSENMPATFTNAKRIDDLHVT